MNIALINENLMIAESIKNLLLLSSEIKQVRIFRHFDAFLKSGHSHIHIAIVSSSYTFPEAVSMLKLYTDKFFGRVKFIIISDAIEEDYILKAREYAIWYFLTASSAKEDLPKAISYLTNEKCFSYESNEKMIDMLFMYEHPDYALTDVENSILQKICSGLSAEEIADEMKMHPHEVRSYKKHLLDKFSLSHRSAPACPEAKKPVNK